MFECCNLKTERVQVKLQSNSAQFSVIHAKFNSLYNSSSNSFKLSLKNSNSVFCQFIKIAWDSNGEKKKWKKNFKFYSVFNCKPMKGS